MVVAGGNTDVWNRIVNTVANAPNSNTTITLTYPKGGEIWHVGDPVTIKWTSTNLPKDTPVNIWIWSSNFPAQGSASTGEPVFFITGISNTGSYKWTIPNSVAGYSVISPQDTIGLGCAAALPNIYGSNGDGSAYFTITN